MWVNFTNDDKFSMKEEDDEIIFYIENDVYELWGDGILEIVEMMLRDFGATFWFFHNSKGKNEIRMNKEEFKDYIKEQIETKKGWWI